jgi:site-specific DNA-methyltransferase (adenine-specific)
MKKEVIGNATLYLGDCMTVLQDISANVLITDPPYGVNLGDHGGAKDGRANHVLVKGRYESYVDSPENFSAIVVPAIATALRMTERGAVFCPAPGCWQLPPPDQIGGVYLPAAQGRSKWGFTSIAPLLLYGRAPNLQLGAKATAWRSTAASEENGHPCPKPLQWMIWVVDLVSKQEDVVVDPFMGSGTTGAACMQLNRKFVGIEIEPKYFDISCERIENAQRQERLFA